MKENSVIPAAAQEIMKRRFGKDALIALATQEGSWPHVRTVDAYYLDGAFYAVTHALSGKMRQMEINPNVAVCGEWFPFKRLTRGIKLYKLLSKFLRRSLCTKLRLVPLGAAEL